MRALLAVAALAALAAGCGSSTSPSERGAPTPGSLEALWKQSGQRVALIPGTRDYSPGDLRISFLVVDNRGKLIAPPRARFWIARSLASKPFPETVARLEPVGVAGVSEVGDAPSVYVAHVRVNEPGTYYAIAESLRAHVPFVVTFATPRYCSSRTCGPVVDVVDQIRRRFA
ncbi:MAG: hypothetical protein M3R37_12735, partial [Actinomycetota bacterium]|nr:hypothetical protein [Actinomycetota bacterium]